jgi:hypothetical protein
MIGGASGFFGAVFLCQLETTMGNEGQDAGELSTIEPGAVYTANVDDDPAYLTEVAAQHELATDRAGPIDDRVSQWIIPSQPSRHCRREPVLSVQHGREDVVKYELTAATPAVVHDAPVVLEGIEANRWAARTSSRQTPVGWQRHESQFRTTPNAV